MTLEQVQNNLRISLDHFVGLGNVLKSSYTSFFPSEKGVMIYGLLVAGRRLASLVKEAEKWQQKSILNVTGIDLVKTRGDLLGVIEYLKQCDCDVEISMLREDDEPLFDSDRIVERENYHLMFPTKESSSGYRQARRLLIEESPTHFEELDRIVKDIDNRFSIFLEDERSIRRDSNIRVERLRVMRKHYRETQWNQTRERLISQVKGELKDKENKGKTEIDILQSLLQEIVLNNTKGNRKSDLGFINQQRGDDEKLAATIVNWRDKLTDHDLMEHFEFVESEKWLTKCIEMKRLREPCDDYDGKLFPNKAAKEFTTLMKPTIKRMVDFSIKINIAMFYAALRDYGIVIAEERNATLMAQFIKDVYEEDVSPDSINKPIRKCLGKSFCSFDNKNHGDFTDKEYAKYKDVYWCCFAIIQGFSSIRIGASDDYHNSGYHNLSLKQLYNGMEDWQIDKLYFAGFVLRGANLGI